MLTRGTGGASHPPVHTEHLTGASKSAKSQGVSAPSPEDILYTIKTKIGQMQDDVAAWLTTEPPALEPGPDPLGSVNWSFIDDPKNPRVWLIYSLTLKT